MLYVQGNFFKKTADTRRVQIVPLFCDQRTSEVLLLIFARSLKTFAFIA